MSNQIKIFMAQKQKLKSERGNLNEGIKDIFMTLDPFLFSPMMKELAYLRDTDKTAFNQFLEIFEERKKMKPEILMPEEVRNMQIIQNDEELNRFLCDSLLAYWFCQNIFNGGYFWHMMPKKKENESDEQFDIRRKRMEDNLMQVMLDVLDDCDYYIKGTQNAQKTQK